MWRATSTLAVGLMFMGEGMQQDLPPGVLLLSRIKRHIKEELQHLPNVTCLETVQRVFQPAHGKARHLDTIRLEILSDGKQELYASPGDRRFAPDHPITYAGSGVLGNGVFGLYLKDILVTGNASYEYKGEEQIGGRRLARYDYRLPVLWSGYVIHTTEGSGTVGLYGSFWADPATNDVSRLDIIADAFPPTLPLTEAVTSINYARVQLSDNRAVLLPESGDFRMVKFSGEISHNQIEFTHCRAFDAQSTVTFPESEQVPRFGVAAVDQTLRALPGGLRVTVQLRTRITGELAVGTLIDAVIAANASAKGSVAVAAGSPVRGRIRRLERYAEPSPHFVVALEFTEVEVQGIRHRFDADLMELGTASGVQETLATETMEVSDELGGGKKIKKMRESIRLSRLPGVATFFYKGSSLDVHPGFLTVWKTRDVR